MTVWVLQAECGDYYCGCGGGHIVAVTDDESKIPGLVEEAEKDTNSYGPNGGGTIYRSWIHGVKVTRVDLNTLREYNDTL